MSEAAPSADHLVSLETIREAAERIEPWIHRTPIRTSRALDAIAGCELHLKCEHLQRVGAFKARGAHNAVMQLDDETAARGVAAHSSGNHAAALALAARNREIPAYVVMPENTPRVKKDAVAGYGADITWCEPTLEAREATLARVLESTGAEHVHPYDDPRVINGQGSVGVEIAFQMGGTPPDVVLAPVGGGGLVAGLAVAIKALLPDCEVIAIEPAGADDAARGFHGGEWVPQLAPNTIADGLLTSVGRINFELIRRHVDDVLTVEDDVTIEAMRLVFSRMKQVIEPSGAVPLAGVLAHRERFAGRRVALVASGGNVDLDALPWMTTQSD
jgi:threonine dehydratase